MTRFPRFTTHNEAQAFLYDSWLHLLGVVAIARGLVTDTHFIPLALDRAMTGEELAAAKETDRR